LSQERRINKYELIIYKIENLSVINIRGKIDSGNSEDAEAELNAMLDNDDKYYIFDLCGLEYISSAGLRVFLSASKKIKGSKGNFVFCEVSEEIREIFDMTGLLNVFTLCPTLEAAAEKIKSSYL